MSQYFKVDRVILWNPATRVAELFFRTSEALAPAVGMPTGIGSMRADVYDIDYEVFLAFVDALVQQYLSSSHAILRALQEGFIATALVMTDRAGSSIRSLNTAQELDLRDVSVGTAGVAPLGDAARLRHLADEHARSMPT